MGKPSTKQTTTHEHKWEFSRPIFGKDESYATYYCDCGASHALVNGEQVTIDSARELADESYDYD